MIEYTSDTRPLDADPLDVWRQIPAELDYATRLRIERRAWWPPRISRRWWAGRCGLRGGR